MVIRKRTSFFTSGLRITVEFHGKKNILGDFSGLFSVKNSLTHRDLKI